jgi:hypothetical protein
LVVGRAYAVLVDGLCIFLRYFVPCMRDLSRVSSEARSLAMDRVMDGHTNTMMVKLFSCARRRPVCARGD